MLLAGQIWSLVLAIIGFVCAFQARASVDSHEASDEPGSLLRRSGLTRFPPFWLGLGLLVYLLIQAANPSFKYATSGGRWWLVTVRNRAWLPTSIESPFLQFNLWRQFIIYISAWLVMCSVWIGFTSRRALRILLTVLVLNAVAVGALLVIQQLTADHRIPWPIAGWTALDLTACFANRNLAGAYLALSVFPTIALAIWFQDFGERTLKKSTPAGIFALSAWFLATVVVFTLSRGATLMMAGAIVMLGPWFFGLRRWGRPAKTTNRILGFVTIAIFGLLICVTIQSLDFTEMLSRIDQLAVQKESEPSVHARLVARAAALDMLRATGGRGVGAGGFRFLFTEYAKKYPEIYRNGTVFWEHAHCDWLEVAIELGVIGDLALLSGALWWVSHFVRSKIYWNPVVIPLLFGCFQTMAHAAFDFPFQCPAIMFTWVVLITVAGKWAKLSAGDSEIEPAAGR